MFSEFANGDSYDDGLSEAESSSSSSSDDEPLASKSLPVECAIREANEALSPEGAQVKIGRTNGLRGMVARHDIERGTVLATVNVEDCLTVEAAKQCLPDGIANCARDDQELLALHLLYESAKGAESKYASHIASMPLKYDSPIFWRRREMKELRGSPLLPKALKLFRQTSSDYTKLLGNVLSLETGMDFFTSAQLTLDRYRWALATVFSRFMDFGALRVGCPFLDMFNHDRSLPVCHRLHAHLGTVSVIAGRDLEKGNEACINYGKMFSSSKLLLFYGFVDGGGLSYELFLPPVNADVVDDDDELREKILMDMGIDMRDGTTVELTLQDPLPSALYKIMLVTHITPFDLDDIRDDNESGKETMEALRNCKAPRKNIKEIVKDELHSFFKLLLRQYPTTLDVDMQILDQDKKMPWRRRVAIMHRIGEKQVLHAALARVAAGSEE